MRNLTLFFALAVSLPAHAFTTQDQLLEPAPTGHIIGKDNYVSPTSSRNVFHHPGEDCGRCHKPGGKASNFDFSMAGTIYTDRTGRTPMEGAEIILRDYTGKVISMTSNAAGNFATQATIGSDPQARSTATPGPTVADPLGHAATWRYKSWIKLGEYESPMVTVAGVGSTTVNYSRMGCGMHHGPTGSRGALNLGTSTLISYPAAGISYKQHIQPILLNRCKACHIPSDNTNGPNATYPVKNDTAGGTITADNKVKFNGNLDLATYTGSSKKSTTTYARDKTISDVVNMASPDQSGLLSQVVQGSKSHSGGWFWKTTDPDYKVIRRWISEGALNN